jgi:hypothetical protein
LTERGVIKFRTITAESCKTGMRTILLTPARSRGAANASDAPELRLRVVTKAGMSKPSSAGRDYPLAK